MFSGFPKSGCLGIRGKLLSSLFYPITSGPYSVLDKCSYNR